MEEEKYKKLPSEDKCVHKLWKARVAGYEEVTSLFKQLDDEKSPEFAKYLGLVKKFVVDSNALGQEKGLEATLAYVENYAHAGKTVSEVMSRVVKNCIAAPKAKTRKLALQVTLMYIEIGKHKAVEEELIKGMELKNQKIVTACITAWTIALREFGPKIIKVKPLLKKISTLLSDRDKGVRDKTKLMVIEMYRWIGTKLRVQLQTANLRAIQITELESEFTKFEGQKPTPTRYIRSQQVKQAKLAQEQAKSGDVNDKLEEEDAVPEIDPLELVPAVEILSKVPKNFYKKIEDKKWQKRSRVLESVESLVKNPKLENGDYADLVRACMKVIQVDKSTICVALACRVIAGLANGLKNKFQTYSGLCIRAILEKFKEKKQKVVTALREAGDAVYLTTNLKAILKHVIEALNKKNPSVKTETSLFLARSFTKTISSAVKKRVLKAITAALTKNMNVPDPGVRDATAEALGTLMKLVGEESMAPFLIDLEKDNLEIAKIKEYCDSAVIVAKSTGVKKKRPVVTPKETKSASKPEPKKASGVVKSASVNSLLNDDAEEGEEQVNIQDLMPRVDISNQITDSLLNELSDKSWKVRFKALSKLQKIINEAKFIKPNLGDLAQALSPRINDSKVEVALYTLFLCESICKAMGPPFKQYIRVLFPSILQGLNNSKAAMRASYMETFNCFKDQCGYKEFFEGEMIADALKCGSPSLRIELWGWLAENLPKVPPKQIPREELMACITHLYSNVEDREAADVKRNAQEAILGYMMQTEKAKPDLPIKPLPAKKVVEKEKKVVRGTKPVANAKNAVKKTETAKAAPTSSGHKKDEDIDTSPLLISDKDMSLLEERIKRSSRKVISAKSDTNSTIITTAISPHKDNSLNRTIIKQNVAMVNNDEGNNDNYEDLEEDILPVNIPSSPKEITGPFKLDPDFMQELERSRPPKPVKLKLKSYSLDFLHEEIRVPTIEEASAQIKSGKTSHNINFIEAVAGVSYGGNKQSLKKQDAVIERLIKQIGSENTSIAIGGMTQLRDILDSPRAEAMADYEDEFMKAVITQFKNLQGADLTIDVIATKTYQNLFSTTEAFYANKTLGNKVSVPLIKELTHQMIDLLVQERLNKIENGDAYDRVINLHCVKFIERSDHTNAICALVQLIIEYINSQKSDKHVDLVMKCLWRVIKLMPQHSEADIEPFLANCRKFFQDYVRNASNRSRSGSDASKRSRSGSNASKRSGSRSRSPSAGSRRSRSGSAASKRSQSGSPHSKRASKSRSRSRSKGDDRSGSNSPNLQIDEGEEGGEKRQRESSEEPVTTKKRKTIMSDSEDEGRGGVNKEKVDAADIFGDADDISSEDEKDDKKDSDKDGRRSRSDDERRSRSRSRSRSKSGDEDEQRQAALEDEDKENEPEPIPETRIDVEVPKISCDLGKDIHFVKLPNFLSVETRPFDPETYEDEIDEEEPLDEEGRARLKLKVENTIRWREIMDKDGNMKKESNARMVRWSDGSYSLHLGSEIFDVYKQPLQGDHNHLFIRQGTGLEGQAVFRTKLSFRPHSTDNPTRAHTSSFNREEEASTSSFNREEEASTSSFNTEEEASTSSFNREEEASDDDGAISLNAIKSKYKGGGNVSKGGAIYSSDEEGSDIENSRTKKKGKLGNALKDSDEEEEEENSESE